MTGTGGGGLSFRIGSSDAAGDIETAGLTEEASPGAGGLDVSGATEITGSDRPSRGSIIRCAKYAAWITSTSTTTTENSNSGIVRLRGCGDTAVGTDDFIEGGTQDDESSRCSRVSPMISSSLTSPA